MKLHVHHRTHYRYARPVSFGPHQLMFHPRERQGIRIVSFKLNITPAHQLHWIRDPYENNIGLLDFQEKASDLLIEAEGILEMQEGNPFDFIVAPDAVEYPFAYDYELRFQLSPYLEILYPRDTPAVRLWLAPLLNPARRWITIDLLLHLNKTLYQDIAYQRRERKGVQSPAETLTLRTGSCRDSATLFMEACRFLGLAARFVSGYMYHSEIDGRMSMHSWAEIFLPGAGWIGFDPSWGILADAQYIPVAVTHHPEHAPPIAGTYFGLQRDYLRTEVDLYVRRVAASVPHEAHSTDACTR